ncbi:MAG: hypothetical protein ABFS22_04540 [Pseudomonadota bacterium]
MDHCVFIHTNHKQIVGALVAEYALRRNSRHNDRFDVRLIQLKDHPFFSKHEGQQYLRDGMKRPWLNEDLQSFTPLRFMPPELMGYQGRAVVIDPDIFAAGDVWELLSRDMQGKAIMCRPRGGSKGLNDKCLATSAMLLDCAKLTHWNVERQFNEMFESKRDYMDWICLKTEPRETIGLFENEWNDFDHLTPQTKMLHTTKRRTQPWKTGLPIDHRPREKFRRFPPLRLLMKARRKLLGEYALLGHYKRHPDPNQENFFFGLLKECLDQDIINEDIIRSEMSQNHVRHDALDVLDRTPPLAPAA